MSRHLARHLGSAMAVAGFAVIFAAAPHARAEGEAADESDPAALFRAATSALASGRATDAIAKLEALGDHGVVDPVASYDRGLAYASRVRGGGEQAGDLGRAAHGFEEARELTRDPRLAADAARALAAVRGEIARRRARGGEPAELDSGISLGRTFVLLIPENAWAALAVVGSIAMSLGLVVRMRTKASRAKVAAITTASIAAVVFVVATTAAWSARRARLEERDGVVVLASRLLDGRHIAIDGLTAVPEGARVRLLDESSGFSRVTVGALDGWLPRSAVLPIAKEPEAPRRVGDASP